jgi:predicted RNase H-like HicB family nuclease
LTYLSRVRWREASDLEAVMSALHYDSYTEARTHFKELLDAAERGQPATVRRESSTAMVVDASRLLRLLLDIYPSRAQVVAEEGGWSVFIPGLPVAADGATFDEAITEMVDALREYADDWQDHLYNVPNHADNWGLVHLIALSTDDQLREWLAGAP